MHSRAHTQCLHGRCAWFNELSVHGFYSILYYDCIIASSNFFDSKNSIIVIQTKFHLPMHIAKLLAAVHHSYFTDENVFNHYR